MNRTSLKIATRQSDLALWQTRYVTHQLHAYFPKLSIEWVPVVTEGDRLLDQRLDKIGGKGLFVKELERLLLSREVDLAVHSLKDLPAHLPPELIIGAVCERASPLDVLITLDRRSWSQLPANAVVGTSSLRRMIQLQALRPDVRIKPLRGNVPTRVQKLLNQEFDAIILAQAGLDRLQLDIPSISFTAQEMLPAVGQGIIGIECRKEDLFVLECLQRIHHIPTAVCMRAERALNAALNGSCQVPLAAYAELQGNQLRLQARIGCLDGQTYLSAEGQQNLNHAENLGQEVASLLFKKGAGDIIESIRAHGFLFKDE
jgi:hydroxymethylbilane synthase